jgi:undecaprenyl-diphosphatase
MILTQLTEINIALFNFINHNLQNSFFDFLMPLITNIGSDVFLLLVCILLFIWGMISKNKPLKYLAITGFVAILLADSIIGILKVLIHEPRPFQTLNSVHLLVNESDPYSFPSGHTGNIFSFATSIGLSWKIKNKNKNIKLAWLLIPLAFIIGFSRIYVGVHYPFDVIVGGIIGVFAGLFAMKIMKLFTKTLSKI